MENDRLQRMAARVAGAPTLFCVEWEGRGYTAESWAADRAVMEAALGPGPVWGGPADTGFFFAGREPSAEEDPEVTVTRKGQASPASREPEEEGEDSPHDSYMSQLEESAGAWQEFPDWAAVEQGLQIFT